MILVLIFIILFMKESKGEWKLVWNEEFGNLDTQKWEIENELIKCQGNHIGHSNCNTNSERNLRLINGTLAITAIHEKHLNKNFTSGAIKTIKSFTYGRFEVRTAFPKGKMLRSSILMFPEKFSPEWAKNGQINVVTHDQTSKLASGLHYDVPGKYKSYENREFTAPTSLNDFHTYAIEWDQFEFKWFFDGINYLTINISRSLGSIYAKNGQPFDMPFRLLIYLGVDKSFTIEDVMDWKCSLLIIDYVRIYEWVNGEEKHNFQENKASTDDICSHVMPLITPMKKLNQNSPNITTIVVIISVISSLLFIVLIGIIVFLFIRQKKLERMNVETNPETYDDILDSEGYDALNDCTDYSGPYQELSFYDVESDGKVKSSEVSDKNVNAISNTRYSTRKKKF